MIKDGEQQFCLIQAFMAYCRLRLVKERINIFIDPNKCLSASKVLPIAIAAIQTELEEANKNLSELDELISRVSIEEFSNEITIQCPFVVSWYLRNIKYFNFHYLLQLKTKPKHTNFHHVCIAMGALGLVTFLLSKMYIT